MNVGLYFGSFNPIHHGHLIIANFVVQNTKLDQVWFVVSPQNPLKPSKNLLNEYQRLYLVQLAIEGERNLKASNIEFSLPKPSYTVETLAHLEEKHPGNQYCVVMGSDSFENIARWKNYEFILENYPIFIYTRPGHAIAKEFTGPKTSILNAPLLEISATHIRENLRNGKSIRYLVPENVREEIEKGSYYRR
jgi:nicotinate-nucleotide adenylyltransferase